MKPELIENVVQDLREGLGDIPVMEKYQISPDQLMEIKNQHWVMPGRPARLDKRERRNSRRQYLVLKIQVHELGNDGNCGIINDMTRRGIQLLGIEAEPGSEKTFAVVGDKAGAFRPFVFQGACQWAKNTPEGVVTGYAITLLTGDDVQQARNLMRSLTLEG